MEGDEDFIHTKYGYCFYELKPTPFIYNLFVHERFRKQGHSKHLLKLVIAEIRRSGFKGAISIEANPKDDKFSVVDLVRYYKSMGLEVVNGNRNSKG